MGSLFSGPSAPVAVQVPPPAPTLDTTARDAAREEEARRRGAYGKASTFLTLGDTGSQSNKQYLGAGS